MRITVLALALLAVLASSAQPLKQRGPSAGGTVSLGVRSSFSLFSSGDHGAPGTGAGGQARVRISDRVNTDWFYDYFTGPAGSLAHREDQHIGWSVLFYMRKPTAGRQRLQPYVLAGHCFDYSKQQSIAEPENFAERWSSAVQAGLGTHLNVTDRADFSLVCQYMAHLGTDIVSTIASKSISNFKLREFMPIGARVTLRDRQMYEFLDRLVTVALPRVRDFKGINDKSFDGRSIYNLGVLEQIIFPEIDIDKVNKISGMDITFVTSAQTDKEAKSLLAELGLPFKKN